MASFLDALLGNPENQGIFAAAARVLQNSGPSRTPYTMGQALGDTLGGYQDHMQQQRQRKMLEQRFAQERELADYALRDKKSDYEAQEAQRARAKSLLDVQAAYQKLRGQPQSAPPVDRSANAVMQGLIGGGMPQMEAPGVPVAGGMPSAGDGTDLAALAQERLAYARYLQDAGYSAESYAEQEKALKMMPEFDTTPRTGNDASGKPFQYLVGKRGERKVLEGTLPREELKNVNGMWVNPFAQRDGALGPQDPNQPFSLGANGQPIANQAYQDFQIRKSRAGASSVSVNTATKPFLSEIGKGAGEAVNTAYQGALAATKTLQNVEQIRQGLGNAIIGPGAGARVTLAQLGQTLGVTGKNTTEQLANTRMVVQGLARQEMSAAEAMKGQGQITESERVILRRAESGMIGDMTAPELNTLLSTLEKTARYRIGAHQANMQRLQSDPNAQGIVDYMRVDAPSAPNAGGTPSDIADLLKKYGGK